MTFQRIIQRVFWAFFVLALFMGTTGVSFAAAPQITPEYSSYTNQNPYTLAVTVKDSDGISKIKITKGESGAAVCTEQVLFHFPTTFRYECPLSFSGEGTQADLWIWVRDQANTSYHENLPSVTFDRTAPAFSNKTLSFSPQTGFVTLSWNAAQDNPSGIQSYRVYRDGTFVAQRFSLSFGEQITGTHSYRIQAVDRAGNTSSSGTDPQGSVTVPAPQPAPPPAPVPSPQPTTPQSPGTTSSETENEEKKNQEPTEGGEQQVLGEKEQPAEPAKNPFPWTKAGLVTIALLAGVGGLLYFLRSRQKGLEGEYDSAPPQPPAQDFEP